jgi:hypothetical protein
MADCPEVEALAAELALGIVSGSERAETLAHLGTCPSCRRLVDSLTAVADPLLLLAPPAEPSIGFESRVLAATSAAAADRPPPTVLAPRRKRRWPGGKVFRAAAAAVVVVIAAAGGLVLGQALDEEPSVRTALAVSASGRATCRAFAYGDDTAWVFVSLEAPPEWSADYLVEITTEAGGSPAAVGTMKLAGGHASLGTTVDVPASDLRAIRVLDANGTLRYEAPFSTD